MTRNGLAETVGSQAGWLQQLALGIDDRPVEPNRESKSCGAERTFSQDLQNLDEVRAELGWPRLALRGVAGERMTLRARTVTVKIRYDDFTTITRSQSAPSPISEDADIAERAFALLARTEAGQRPVRLVGVSVHGLVTPGAETGHHAEVSPGCRSMPTREVLGRMPVGRGPVGRACGSVPVAGAIVLARKVGTCCKIAARAPRQVMKPLTR